MANIRTAVATEENELRLPLYDDDTRQDQQQRPTTTSFTNTDDGDNDDLKGCCDDSRNDANTTPTRTNHHPHHHPHPHPHPHNPTGWLLALSLCTFTTSWLLISAFPYSGFMAISLRPDLTTETAGPYAGLLASAFMIGRAVTSYGWGQLADRYGRRFVLFVSLICSAIFSILFGISSTFGQALLFRFCLGSSNGMQGIVKTAVSELAHGDEYWETRGMSIVSGMWAWAFLVGPALSGTLSEPVKQYPHSTLVQTFQDILIPFPFVLPNLVSVMLCIIAIMAVTKFVPETLPKHKCQNPTYILYDLYSWCLETTRSISILLPFGTTGQRNMNHQGEGELDRIKTNNGTSISTSYSSCSNDTGNSSSNGNRENHSNGKDKSSTETHRDDNEDCVKTAQMYHAESGSFLSTSSPRSSASLLLRKSVNNHHHHASDDTISEENKEEEEDIATISSLWSQIDTRNYLIVYWLFSFFVVAVDEAFPLFCISHEAGLGLTEGTIGSILSGAGFLFAVCQYFCYAAIVDRFGLRVSIQVGVVFSSILVFFIPGSLLFNYWGGPLVEEDSTLTWGTWIYLSIVLATLRIFSLVFFSSIFVATNRTVIPSHRATMNGLSMLGGSFAKGLGPTFAGLLVAFSVSSGVFSPHVGAVLIFVVIGLSGCATAVMTFILLNNGEN